MSGPDMVSVLNQTGLNRLVANWIKEAWTYVQAEHTNWGFLLSDKVSSALVAGTEEYTAAALGITDLGSWDIDSVRLHDTDTGVASQAFVQYVPWAEYREVYDVGTRQTGRPAYFSVAPNSSLVFYPLPDKGTYELTLRYFKAPVELVDSSDVPACPVQFHDIIVYKALEYYGVHDDAPEVVFDARNKYSYWLGRLGSHQLPQLRFDAAAIGEEALA